MPSTKNIIIFLAIGGAFALVYIFFIRKPAEPAGITSANPSMPAPLSGTLPLGTPGAAANGGATTETAASRDFLTLLLSVRGIKLDDSILSDKAFMSLDGSHSITLTPDGNEGRPNPFAPLGSDIPRSTTN